MNPEILVKYLYEDLTLKRARVYDIGDATPGKFTMRILEPLAHLGPCCSVPQGDSNMVQKDSECVCILDGQEYCETDLSQVLRDSAIRFTAGAENAGSIEQVIIDGQIAAFVEALDILSFQGDKTLADNNLNRIDGLLKIAKLGGAIDLGLINTGTAYSLVNAITRNIPITARKMGPITIFVSEEFAETYFEICMKMNLYHYNPGSFKYGDNRPVIGKDNFTILPTRALNGTNKILATPERNIVWFYSQKEDHNTLSWKYTEYHQKYYWRIKTIFGVDLVIPEWAVIAEYDPSVLLNGVTVDVNVISPLGANGGILTTDTPTP